MYIYIVYVDDIIFLEDDTIKKNMLKQNLAKEFEDKDIGQLL